MSWLILSLLLSVLSTTVALSITPGASTKKSSLSPQKAVTDLITTSSTNPVHINKTSLTKLKPSVTLDISTLAPSQYNRSCLFENKHTGWLCNDQVTCIWKKHVCDMVPYQCPDGSDEEEGCTEHPRYCMRKNIDLSGWKCDDGECLYNDHVCNSVPDCKDGSDERAGCDDLDLILCPSNPSIMTERWAAHKDCRECKAYFNNWRCNNGHCISKLFVCNGEKDCMDRSDEWEGCDSATCS